MTEFYSKSQVDLLGSHIGQEIKKVKVIDENSGELLKFWTGTQSQYDAIATKDLNTLYVVKL